MVFLFDLYNPNGIGVSLAGFDYDLEVDTHSFLSGKQKDALTVPAKGHGQIRLPLTLKFKDLYALRQTLKSQDSTAYALQCGFTFDLPVLGPLRVPVKHSGRVPNVKPPSLKLKEFKVRQLSLAGADLLLSLSLNNPNGFAFDLHGLDLDFAVNGRSLLKSGQAQALRVEPKAGQALDIPIAVDFLQMGSAVYEMLKGNKALNYRLTGTADMQAGLPLIGRVRLPFDEQGTVKLSR